MLGAKDRRILSELQSDSRLTMQELGERTGMSSSACWRRVKSLEEAGIIDRYAVIFSQYDLSCALEKQNSMECQGYEREDAARIGLNVVLYSLQE